MNKKLMLLGYSGHAYTVIEAALSNKIEILGYFESEEKSQNPFKINFLNSEINFNFTDLSINSFIFPSVGENKIRKKMHQFIRSQQLNEIVLIHTSATIGFQVSVGNSTLIASNVCVNSLSKIGKSCILNTNCVIEHECIIEDYAHVGPGAVLAGNVTVGELTFVGANTTVKQGVNIGKNCIIGAGSVVLNDIPDNTIYVGNPAKYLRDND